MEAEWPVESYKWSLIQRILTIDISFEAAEPQKTPKATNVAMKNFHLRGATKYLTFGGNISEEIEVTPFKWAKKGCHIQTSDKGLDFQKSQKQFYPSWKWKRLHTHIVGATKDSFLTPTRPYWSKIWEVQRREHSWGMILNRFYNHIAIATKHYAKTHVNRDEPFSLPSFQK